MGINKPDVRFVIHVDLPKNLEGYYQETGRAGRDGLPADCLLLFARGDVVKYQRFIDEVPDEAAREVARAQLLRMADFAEGDACRRVGLLGYFGERWAGENCVGYVLWSANLALEASSGAFGRCLHGHEIKVPLRGIS
jgi:ATP-dependent DNA helicase RecQ